MRRRAILVSALLAFFLIPALVSAAEVTEEWVRHIDTAGVHNPLPDIGVDPSGNIVIVGETRVNGENRYAVVKYAPDGSEIWFNTNLPITEDEFLVRFDALGNVYVANGDFRLVKFDAIDGHVLWDRQYADPNGYAQDSCALAVDPAGNSYISGNTRPYNMDVLTVKYDTNGNQVGVWTYNHAGGEDYNSSGVVIDSSGNAFIAATSMNLGNDTFYINVLKIDTEGVQTLFGSHEFSVYVWAYGIAIDPWDNIILTGDGQGPTGHSEALTIKHYADGTPPWLTWSNGATGETSMGIAVDSGGNVFIAGAWSGSTTIIKYHPDGTMDWRRSHAGSLYDWQYHPVADSAGSVYLSQNGQTVKYDAAGNLAWEATHAASTNAIDIDTSGNVYVVGSTYDPSTGARDLATIKYSQGPSTIPDLITLVQQMRADGRISNIGFANTLTSMLTNAQASLDAGNNGAAANALNAAINHIQGGSGMMIDPAAATELIGYINQIIAGIPV